MIPSAIILPEKDLSFSLVQLQSTWQIHGLMLASILCGPQLGIVCALGYITIGLFYLPVFHGGGSVGYILTPDFGYILGFLPAAYICGNCTKGNSSSNLVNYTLYTSISLFILHIIGIIYLFLGSIFTNWKDNLVDLILINSVIPFPSQLLLCTSTSLLALSIKKILILKWISTSHSNLRQ